MNKGDSPVFSNKKFNLNGYNDIGGQDFTTKNEAVLGNLKINGKLKGIRGGIGVGTLKIPKNLHGSKLPKEMKNIIP
jgi:hypothetical protein